MAKKPALKTRLVVTVALLVLLIGAALILGRQDKVPEVSKAETVEVMITKDGFSPSTIVINRGTTVEWVNKDDNPHQVASNPHPVHDGMPGLESEILNNAQEYKYEFKNKGSYNYHDHLNPTVNGTVEVRE